MDEFKLVEDVKLLIKDAERAGVGIVMIPIGMLEALIEKATRGHD
jgi:hypothetical protein